MLSAAITKRKGKLLAVINLLLVLNNFGAKY